MIKNCPMRHENGNCIPAGGFCTANKNICEALLNAYKMGKAQLSKEGTTKDAISRQQALDIFDDYNVSVEYGELEAYSRDRKRLCELPTIQPEPPIIKCKDCKWWRKQKDSAQGRCRLLGIYPTGAWYCGNAERRSDEQG